MYPVLIKEILSFLAVFIISHKDTEDTKIYNYNLAFGVENVKWGNEILDLSKISDDSIRLSQQKFNI